MVDTKNGSEERWECNDLRALLMREPPQELEETEEERTPVEASGLVAVAA
ncbi:MAG: hypothetical protein WCS85_03465 [Candidatus Peribacteraceae bacterium]